MCVLGKQSDQDYLKYEYCVIQCYYLNLPSIKSGIGEYKKVLGI